MILRESPVDYTVEITLQTKRALTEDALFAVAELGGVAVGLPGSRQVETTLTVAAEEVSAAADLAIRRVLERVPGKVIAVDVMTTAEADRRSKEQPQVVGVAEVAELLGVTKQRASMITQRDDFPAPIAKLASGPVWRAGAISTFKDGWRRKPGRPRKSIDIVPE